MARSLYRSGKFVLASLVASSVLLVVIVIGFRSPEAEAGDASALLRTRIPDDNESLRIVEQEEEVRSRNWEAAATATATAAAEQQWRIRDVVALNSTEFLVLLANEGLRDADFEAWDFDLHSSSCCISLKSSSPSEQQQSRLLAIDSIGKLGAIRCALLEDRRVDSVQQVQLRLARRSSSSSSELTLESNCTILHSSSLIFASLLSPAGEAILFSKGLVPRMLDSNGNDELSKQARCVYTIDSDSASASSSASRVVETNLLGFTQEIFRCALPPQELLDQSPRITVRMRKNSELLPSVAHLEQPPDESEASDGDLQHVASPGPLDPRVCACTMVRDVAKFLPEWLAYHSHLGIERFFFYDNNSEDDLRAAIDEANYGAAAERINWPWPKAQEAGLSHCALAAREHCDWVAFMDVDEFIFPRAWLASGGDAGVPQSAAESSILARTIADLTRSRAADHGGQQQKLVGQISLRCVNFGPSGLTQHPPEGVTQGYTCREKGTQRHKSLLRLDAMNRTLQNAVHHFSIDQSRYRTLEVPTKKGVVNHYKYQAWPEFRSKFRSRVSAYVVDWKEARNLNSKDRTPGLDASGQKPADWEQRFCNFRDTELRDYIRWAFGTHGSNTPRRLRFSLV